MRENTAPIVLAAGLSRRFGANKLLADRDGKPQAAHAVAAACAAPVATVVVVVGHQSDAVAKGHRSPRPAARPGSCSTSISPRRSGV